MSLKVLVPAILCSLALACSSPTDGGERDQRLLAYSLSELDGEALPDPHSSLPGLLLWAGDDGSRLAVAQGRVSCAADGTAKEVYLFRLSRQGSVSWDPVWVNLELTCELTGPGSVTFRDHLTGGSLVGTVRERLDGCPVMAKALPSVESLRLGYDPAGSLAELPPELKFAGSPLGDFLAAECLSGS